MRARHKSSGAKFNAAKGASMKSGTSGMGSIPFNNSGTADVGHVHGAASKVRLDKRARGGRINPMCGGKT